MGRRSCDRIFYKNEIIDIEICVWGFDRLDIKDDILPLLLAVHSSWPNHQAAVDIQAPEKPNHQAAQP